MVKKGLSLKQSLQKVQRLQRESSIPIFWIHKCVKDGKLADDHADLSDETFALAPGETAEFTYTYNQYYLTLFNFLNVLISLLFF